MCKTVCDKKRAPSGLVFQRGFGVLEARLERKGKEDAERPAADADVEIHGVHQLAVAHLDHCRARLGRPLAQRLKTRLYYTMWHQARVLAVYHYAQAVRTALQDSLRRPYAATVGKQWIRDCTNGIEQHEPLWRSKGD